MTRDERGSSLVETVLVGLLFMVPLIWLIGVLADVHRGALASTAAAREAGADAARATSMADARRAIDSAVAQAFAAHGIDASEVAVGWHVEPGFDRGDAVEVEVTYPVSVAQLPFLGSASGPTVEVTARHVARIDLFRSRE